MSSHRKREPSRETESAKHVRTLKHSDGHSLWPTIAVDSNDKKHEVIRDRTTGQLCHERPSKPKRSRHTKQEGTLSSIPESTRIPPPSPSRTRTANSDSRVTGNPSTADHAPSMLGETPYSRQPSSTSSRRVPVIVEEAKNEADTEDTPSGQGEEADIPEVVERVKEREVGNGPGSPAGEAEVIPVSIAGESQAMGEAVQPNHIDQLPPQSEPPAPSFVHQKDPSQLSGDQPPSSQTPRDSSSSTGLPPTLNSDSQGSYSPTQLPPSNPIVESRPVTLTSNSASKFRGRRSTRQTAATPISTEGAPGPREDRTHSTNRQPTPTIKTHLGVRAGMDGRPLAEGVLKTNVELSDQDQQLAVMTEFTPMQDPRSYPLPSRATSRNPSRRPHQKAYFPAPTGSLYQLPASPPLLSPNTDPQHSRVLDSERTDYHPKTPPDWYIAPEAEQ
jgi:hypothetical protein